MSLALSLSLSHDGSALKEERRNPTLRLPLARLLQLVMILQRGRFPNAKRLAEACAVSRRTIYRDLGTLEAAGFGVVYRSDRQGYELTGESFLQPAQLDQEEALAILLLSRLCPADYPFGSLEPVCRGIDKVIQALPEELRGPISLCGELILGTTELAMLDLPADRRPIYESIWHALRQRRQMRLWYREDDADCLLSSKVSLYRLVRLDSCWSVVGRSTRHREIHLFRIPWIQRVEVTDETYTIPPRFRLERWLSRSNPQGHSDKSYEIQLRFDARVAPVVQDRHTRNGERLLPRPRGELDLFLTAPLRDELVLWILGFGESVEVIKPEELRQVVKLRAERIARIHQDSSSLTQITHGSDATVMSSCASTREPTESARDFGGRLTRREAGLQ